MHVVWFKFKDDATDVDKAAFMTALDGIADIPNVSSFSHGTNVSPRSSFNYCLIVEFPTAEDEKNYLLGFAKEIERANEASICSPEH